jgi:CelD/BcsL family acetyltransferase involved in cellulose biosynthesis
MAVRVDVFDTFAAAGTTWSEFQSNGASYVFQTREWLESWFENIGRRRAVQPVFVSVCDESGSPVLFFPFQIVESRSIRTLEWLGEGLIDYGAPIIGSTPCEDPAAVWEQVRARLPQVDLIRLSRVPAAVGDVDNPLCRLKCHRHHSSAHFVELDGTWETFYERRTGSKTRSTDRRKRRRLQEKGTLTYVYTNGEESAIFDKITAAMVGQKSERYRQMRAPNMLADEGVRSFFAHPTQGLRDSGVLHVSAFELDGEVITTHWGMRHGDRYYYYMPSYSEGPWMRYSPGRLQLFELFEWCFENGVTVFDFTIGDEPYKKDWCDREMPLYHYLEPMTSKGRIAACLYRTAYLLLSNRFVLTVARRLRGLLH